MTRSGITVAITATSLQVRCWEQARQSRSIFSASDWRVAAMNPWRSKNLWRVGDGKNAGDAAATGFVQS